MKSGSKPVSFYQKTFGRLSTGLVLILPLEVLLWVILMFPFALMIYLSLINWTPMGGEWWTAPFIGAGNYGAILSDTRFILAILRTVFYVGVCGLIEFALGLGIALLLMRNIRFKRFFTSIFILPMMLVPIVVGIDYYLLFFEGGAVNTILGVNIPWLSNPLLVNVPIILGEVWQWTPFMFLVLYSGLVALPEEPFRAARVLGATETQIFRRLTLPMLKPVILIAILIRFLELFKLFDLPFIMAKGGPGFASETISIFMYYQGWTYWKLSYIAAGAVVILIIILVIIIIGGKSIYRIRR